MTRSEILTGVAIVAICPVVAGAAVFGGKIGLLAVIGVAGLVVGIYVGLRHPLWLYWSLAAVLGALPFGFFPGVHLPLYLLFVASAALAALIHPSTGQPLHPIEKWIVLLIAVSGLAMVFTGVRIGGIVEFARWALCTVIVVVLTRLPREHLVRFGQIFVVAASFNALWGIAIVFVDKNQKSFKILKPFGYGGGEGLRGNTQILATTGDGSSALRLGGTWVLPNTAGLCLAIALGICLIVFAGYARIILAAILLAGVALTLSRSALFSVVLGILLVLIFHGMKARQRAGAISLCLLAVLVAFAVPQVRGRLFSSLGGSDVGATARSDAFAAWPGAMSGHWLFGAGWGRAEFQSGEAAYALVRTLPSNVPALTAFRAGSFAAIILVVALVLACVAGYRAIRSDSLPYALYGGISIGVCVVALNLDKPVVDIQAATATFSMMLAFLIYVDELRRKEQASSKVEPVELLEGSDSTQGRTPASSSASTD